MNWITTSFLILSTASLFAQMPQQTKEDQIAIAKKYPGLRIQAAVGTRTKSVPGSSYMRTMTTSPSIVIESAQTQPISAATAVCILITMNTQEKYRQGSNNFRVATNEKIEIPAADKGTRRKFEFAQMETKFDSDRDKTNVGGDVYKYFLIAVLSDDKKYLHLESSCPGLLKYLQTHPDDRKRYIELAPNTTFSSNFQD
jgi:hypothetical protein